VVFAVDTWRWAGVPFRLRSGKALTAELREAVVTFQQPPRIPDGLSGYVGPDRLVIGFRPDWLGMDLNINGPGDPAVLDSVTLAADFAAGRLSPYGEVLRGVFDGDPTLSVRGDTAEQCWRIVEPVLEAWRGAAAPCPCRSTAPAAPDPVTRCFPTGCHTVDVRHGAADVRRACRVRGRSLGVVPAGVAAVSAL
jgi:glucose-6-phosphate 1-dehydrogenase